jgi:uncharacterized integral membrane protein
MYSVCIDRRFLVFERGKGVYVKTPLVRQVCAKRLKSNWGVATIPFYLLFLILILVLILIDFDLGEIFGLYGR